ncbi:MAG: SDR family NAD(P)-dependent oxidoreductase [Acidimicrobiales bacterium]
MRFDGRSAFVTGAGAGIGRATALRLGVEGAGVVCFDLDLHDGQTTADQITEAGGRAMAAGGDVRDPGAIQAACDAGVEHFGAVHLLVNNAGTHTRAGIKDLSEEDWDLVVDVNMKGPFLVSQIVGREIGRAGGGAIVNITSIESVIVVATQGSCQPHYNASKGGLLMLTKALAHDFAGDGIRVNAVAPGPVHTPQLERALDPEAAQATFRQHMLIRRLGRPEEIADRSQVGASTSQLGRCRVDGWVTHERSQRSSSSSCRIAAPT